MSELKKETLEAVEDGIALQMMTTMRTRQHSGDR